MSKAVKYIPVGEGQSWTVIGGDVIVCKVTGDETDGMYAVFETTTPAGAGPPPHVHHREDEIFYVLEGDFEFQIGPQTIKAGAGSFLIAPKDIPHRFSNVGATQGRLLITVMPAGIELFFAELSKMPGDGQPDFAYLARLTEKYGIEFIERVA